MLDGTALGPYAWLSLGGSAIVQLIICGFGGRFSDRYREPHSAWYLEGLFFVFASLRARPPGRHFPLTVPVSTPGKHAISGVYDNNWHRVYAS